MRLARIKTKDSIVSVFSKEGMWWGVKDLFADQLELTGKSYSESEFTFLAPVQPGIILAMAHNGTKENLAQPAQAFQKSIRTLSGPNDPIYKDETLGRMEVECELVAVIKKKARNLTSENVLDHILGFTIGNDVTLPEQTTLDNLLLQSKNGDGFTPIGPWIETEITAPDNLKLFVNINGKRVIESSTNKLARGLVEQLTYITKYTTLYPGDIVLGGSPTTWFAVNAGDVAEVEIEGIGILSNPIQKL